MSVGEGIPATINAPPISVPGPPTIAIAAQAVAAGVEWNMGDGTDAVWCEGLAPAPTADCKHIYTQSSAGQNRGQFAGTATIVWHVTYTINTVLAPDAFDVVRQDAFNLEVAEGQAIVLGQGGGGG
jgi:hypothetical protein